METKRQSKRATSRTRYVGVRSDKLAESHDTLAIGLRSSKRHTHNRQVCTYEYYLCKTVIKTKTGKRKS